MKPVAFDLLQAGDVASALAALAGGGDEAKPISGTQSIGPMLNLRLARPSLAVDISRIAALRECRDEGDAILYGAAITHAEIEDGALPDATPGWMAAAARRIAYRAVRNRGTLGGSLAHADPAADWVNVLTALDASVVLRSVGGERTVPLTGFFSGSFSTVLEPGEIITHVRVRKRSAAARWAYWKYCRKVGEFAMASAAVLIDPERTETRILVGAIERPPALLRDPEAVLAGRLGIAEAVTEAAPGLSAQSQALHVAAVGRAIAMADDRNNG
ncbi:FAD binding domain-containing protein [Terrihabitans rhizophilus]|uniref:FAD binding domain-containing protein n=1 Tax=Terrihabitans rhizophilus TaxID=3092662 RepID=A0ABU4RPZ3_9HYPH|nr:FAD binding domain-containing protein [Terrihabitans sp. PJ23]MDX6806248.1 FAD binding domain-containing protein [Terrihabitans sp. PJ23]